MLHTTHCIAGHTSDIHWRKHQSATTWAGLQVQVRRWQAAASLAWTDADILDVARYLNESIYHFDPSTTPGLGLGLGSVAAGPEPVPRQTRLAPAPRP